MSIPDFTRYQLVRRMGRTSFGESYEAVHPRRPGRFLVEALSSLRGVGERLKAFERDVSVVASLRHPYILQTVEIDALPDGTPIVVSELPEGDTLEAWLAKGHALSRDAVVSLVIALGSALHAAHAAGVSHGDVGAHVVFLLRGPGTDMGLPRLVGFGGRHVRAEATVSQGGPALDAHAEDIAALARLAERLLKKELEPDGDEAASFFLPPATKIALERALARDDGEPFESSTAFAAALAASLSERPADVAGPRSHRAIRGEPPSRWAPRASWLVVAASSAVAVAGWAPASARVQVRRWLSSEPIAHVDGQRIASALASPPFLPTSPVPLAGGPPPVDVPAAPTGEGEARPPVTSARTTPPPRRIPRARPKPALSDPPAPGFDVAPPLEMPHQENAESGESANVPVPEPAARAEAPTLDERARTVPRIREERFVTTSADLDEGTSP